MLPFQDEACTLRKLAPRPSTHPPPAPRHIRPPYLFFPLLSPLSHILIFYFSVISPPSFLLCFPAQEPDGIGT